jgi:MFS transporter, DHA1 family, inner membrane transport protein
VDGEVRDAGGILAHSRNAALVVLACAAFVVGTAEFIVVGVLDVVSRDLGISIGIAGHLVTAYALGISIGAPIVMAVTTKLDRRLLLIGIVGVFAAATFVAVVASDLDVLLVVRFVSGTTHGLFVGVASVVAVTVVPPANQGRAMSMVFGGIAVATVLGVPLGTLIAQLLGWRAVFAGVAALGVIVLLAIVVFVPTTVSPGAKGFAAQARGALAPRVLLVLLAGTMLLGGQFVAFTYLVPYLQEVTHVSRELISVFLLIYGVASAVGAFIGGRFADKSASRTLIGANVLLVPVLGLLYSFGDHLVIAAFVLAAWGVVGFGLVPALQLRVISLAGCGRDLAATLSASAANAGVALGSLMGGQILEHHGVNYVVLVSMAVCAIAFPLTWGTQFLKPGGPGGRARC